MARNTSLRSVAFAAGAPLTTATLPATLQSLELVGLNSLPNTGLTLQGGFDGYVRPDHGRMIWDEVAMPGYGLYDRALGATYLNGLWEAIVKGAR